MLLPLDILFSTIEAVPFAKTEGFADFCGAFPVELARQGQSPVVIMPAYRHVFACGQSITPTGFDFTIPIFTNPKPPAPAMASSYAGMVSVK